MGLCLRAVCKLYLRSNRFQELLAPSLVMDTYEKDEIGQKTWQKLSKIYMGQ